MTLFTTIWAYKTELILLLFFSAPIVYPLCLHRPSRPPINIIILHTLYFLSHLVYSPYDLFAHLPILTPNLVLQQTLDTSPLAQLLLQKLQSLDNRYYYARFGHHTLAQCVWCHNIYDYLLFSIPGIIAPYLVTAIAIGISKWVGEPNATGRANRWRATFGWSLLCLAIGECGIKYGWDVRVVSGDCLNASHCPTLLTIALFYNPHPPKYSPHSCPTRLRPPSCPSSAKSRPNTRQRPKHIASRITLPHSHLSRSSTTTHLDSSMGRRITSFSSCSSSSCRTTSYPTECQSMG